MIAGPNGAGKTTFYEVQLRRLTQAEFVNADNLVLAKLGHFAATPAESALGQALAEARRGALIEAGLDLVMESTFSHPSKVELVETAKAAGYRIVLYHLHLRDADLAVGRVQSRVARGGHPAPEARVRGRFARNPPLIRQAALLADQAFVFDNSALAEPPRRVLTLSAGRVVQVAAPLPAWVRTVYGADLRGSRRRTPPGH